MPAPLRTAGGLLLAGTALAAAWLLPRPEPSGPRPAPPEASVAPPAAAFPPPSGRSGDAAADPGLPADGEEAARPWDNPRYWEAVKRHCPWPPEVAAAWAVLDGPGLAAMNAIELHGEWRRVLADPGGTRRAVAAALDDPPMPRASRRTPARPPRGVRGGGDGPARRAAAEVLGEGAHGLARRH